MKDQKDSRSGINAIPSDDNKGMIPKNSKTSLDINSEEAKKEDQRNNKSGIDSLFKDPEVKDQKDNRSGIDSLFKDPGAKLGSEGVGVSGVSFGSDNNKDIIPVSSNDTASSTKTLTPAEQYTADLAKKKK